VRRLITIMRRVRRQPLLATSLCGVLVLGVLSRRCADRQIVINTSPSVPPGLYMRSGEEPRVGSLIDFKVPDAARDYLQSRTGSEGHDWYILKPIVAGPEDRVDTTGEWLVINGQRVASMPPSRDAEGRELPVWREVRTLGPAEFFVFSGLITHSFDSRCYGPVTREQISSVRRPLFTW